MVLETIAVVFVLLGMSFIGGGAIIGEVQRWWHYLLFPFLGIVALAPLGLTILVGYMIRDHLPAAWPLLIVLAFILSTAPVPLILALRRWLRRTLGLVD